jgi:hypothetical protein
MNDYEKTIEVLQNRVRALELLIQPVVGAAEPKPKTWLPIGGGWWINIDGSVNQGSTHKKTKEFGHERQTEKQAIRAALEMRRFNRLLALRDELCGDDLPDWESKTAEKCRVYRNNKAGKWSVGKDRSLQDVGVYFTKEEHAKRACDMLNSGEVEL